MRDERAAELIIANKELAFQNAEKEKRAAELIIANKELAFQNEEKDKRVAELIIANKELAFQNEQNIELEIQKKQLDEANKLKSMFLSNMSHELRTPLNAIVGFSELALRTSLSQKQYNYLSKIKTSSHILLGLISDILDLSKIEAGKLELEIETFNLEEVIQKAVNQISSKSQENGLELMVFIDEDVPTILNGDSLRLGQVLLNLASNAVKFTDEGKIVIRAQLLENDGIIALLKFSVKDTGIGLTEKQRKKMFQPFTQGGTSTTRKYGGTGLGLSICQELVNLMNGDIWVESEVGVGSTFFFTANIAVADKEGFFMNVGSKECFEQIDTGLGKKNDTSYLPQFTNTKVLLVEDNEINREVAQEILQEAGMIVTIANNGREAVDMVKNNTYDIVLIDIQMPIMDGYEATREIRKDLAYAELPIIAMTANALLRDREKCIKAGMNDHVTKPIDTTLLFQKIAYWIKKEQSIIEEEMAIAVHAPCSPSINGALVVKNGIIPNLAGISVQKGLNRLGGNWKLYFKLGQMFYKNYKNAIKEIRNALDQGDLKEAKILVHNIKGAAGNLSAEDVYLYASKLEDELSFNRFYEVELLLEQLEHALDQTFTSISLMEIKVQDAQSSYLQVVDITLHKQILNKLQKLLLNNNMDALECIEEALRESKDTAFCEKVIEMKDYVDQYDFEAALVILNEVLYSIGEEPEYGNAK